MKIVFILLLCGSFAFAHKLNIFMSQEDEKVYVSAYFASGSVCKGCKIEVFNKRKELIQEGISNGKGEFIVTKLDSLIHVEVEALGGHKVQNDFEVNTLKKEKTSPTQYQILREENKQLKREITLLKEKNSLGDIAKMLLALLVMAGIFFSLKKIKKERSEK